MALHKLLSAGQVLSFVIPVMGASAAMYYVQRGIWPLERTLNNEWFDASAKMMENMPRQGSDKPVRMNPFSQNINMHSVTF